MKDHGGYVVPEAFADEVYKSFEGYSPWRSLMPERDYPPLTLKQRFWLWRHDLKWRLHDRLFGHHCTDDD